MTELEAVRRDHPILDQLVNGSPLVYLDNAATLQMSAPVLEEIGLHYRRDNANVHRGVHTLSRRSTEALERARETAAAFLNAERSEIVFTAGTTGGLNLAAEALSGLVGPGDEVVVTELDHHSNYLPWLELCRRRGARLVTAPISAAGELDPETFAAHLTPRTRIAAFPWASHVLGTVTDAGALIRRIHDAGALAVVDAAQAMRHGRVDVRSLDCDLLAFSGHKLGALTGIGVLYGKKELWERLPPAAFGGGMADTVDGDRASYLPAPARFEAGTPNYAGAVSLAAAMDYLTALGLERIAAREAALTRRIEEILDGHPRVRVLGTPQKRAGAVSFYVPGVSALDLGILLDTRGVAARTGQLCAQPLLRRLGLSSVVRLSPAFYNSDEDLDRLDEALTACLEVL